MPNWRSRSSTILTRNWLYDLELLKRRKLWQLPRWTLLSSEHLDEFKKLLEADDTSRRRRKSFPISAVTTPVQN